MSENSDLGDFVQVVHPKKRAFLLAFMETGSVTESTQIAGVGRQTHYDWLKNDSEYASVFADAEAIAVQSLEDEARKRAKAGSDTLLIFLLKGLRPDRYKDRSQVYHDFSSTSDADLVREGAAIVARVAAQGDLGKTGDE